LTKQASRPTSAAREHVARVLFVAELTKELWRRHRFDVDVFVPGPDEAYDLLVTCRHVCRHVRLVVGMRASPTQVPVRSDIATFGSGCLVWAAMDQSLSLGPYYWFGGAPGHPIPQVDKFPTAQRGISRGYRSRRVETFSLPPSALDKVESIGDILDRLLGFDT